jgi:hypothetical protein
MALEAPTTVGRVFHRDTDELLVLLSERYGTTLTIFKQLYGTHQ